MQLVYFVCGAALLVCFCNGVPVPEPEIRFTSTEAPLDPDHVPSSVCRNMTPVHGNSKPQNGEAPFEVIVSNTNIAPGDIIQVTFKANNPEGFKGIYVQGRNTQTEEAVGEFLPSDNQYVVTSSCPPGENNAASYISRTSIDTVTLEWKAPSQNQDVVFVSTFVKDFATFWTFVPSNDVHISN